MKIFITGAYGALGQALQEALRHEHIAFMPTDLKQLDITNFKAVVNALANYHPDVIMHLAALSNVDECEADPELAHRVNALGTLGIATVARRLGAKLIYVSTNFVFDGTKRSAYYELDPPNPISVYGRTKYEGERYVASYCDRHFIVRTAWLFGRQSKTFLSRFIERRDKPATIDVICDQIGSFTYTTDLAEAVLALAKSEYYGIYHLVNGGTGTWLDFALKAKELARFETEIRPVKTEELHLAARRPLFAALGSRNYEHLFGLKMRNWEQALKDFCQAQRANP